LPATSKNQSNGKSDCKHHTYERTLTSHWIPIQHYQNSNIQTSNTTKDK
jgi:hypothetical protein